MEILKTLILGWSLVISSTLFFKGANGASVFAAVLYGAQSRGKVAFVIITNKF